jgi:hypothetical protein
MNANSALRLYLPLFLMSSSCFRNRKRTLCDLAWDVLLRRGGWVVVVTDAVQPLVPPKGTQILKDLQSRMQVFSPLSRCWPLCVTTISSELSPGPPPFSASLEPKFASSTGPSMTQIILSPTTENALSEGWRPLLGHAVLREPVDAMVF